MPNQKQRGFTLLELMISLSIGLLLIAGTVAMMQNSSKAMKRHEINADAVSAIRLASNQLRHDIQSAGYYGRTRYATDIDGRRTSNPLPARSNDCANDFYTDVQRYVFASNNENPYATTCLRGMFYKPETDILIVRYARDNGNLGATLDGLEGQGIYIYGNPAGGKLVRATNPPSLNQYPYEGRFHADIGKRFYEFVTHIYYIRDEQGSDQNGLYRLVLNTEPGNSFVPELVSTDIVDMQIRLGLEDCDSTALFGSQVCTGGVDDYIDGWSPSDDANHPTYDLVARTRTVSVALTALSPNVQGADQMSTIDHTVRGKVFQTSAAALVQASTYQVRNVEEIFK